MKRVFEFCILAALASAYSCAPETEAAVQPGTPVEIRVIARPSQESRSSCDVGESVIRNVNVYAYRDGRLAASAFSSGESLGLQLASGYRYNLYALANFGETSVPALESDLAGLRLPLGQTSSFSENGIPMAARVAKPCYAVQDGPAVYMDLERLVCKLTVCIERKLSHTSFTVEGAAIRQAAADITPFCRGSAAMSVRDGDSASASDISALNSGGTAFFYVPENSRGCLLPGNTDQWEKVPDNMDGDSELSTWLDVWGYWETPGASADLEYRMYLGRDNCSDFNVDGNAESGLTLSLTDEGAYAASWKVEMSNLDDRRTLRFSSRNLEIAFAGTPEDVSIMADPPDIPFSLYADDEQMEDAGLSWSQDGLGVSLVAPSIGETEKLARLYLRSWDGRLADTLQVVVLRRQGIFTDYVCHLPEYAGQYGSYTFPSASESSPVTFRLGDRTLLVGASAPLSFQDRKGALSYTYDGDRTVYVCAVDEPMADPLPVRLSCGRDTALVRPPRCVCALYSMDELKLSETGNALITYLQLAGKDSKVLDLRTFATPDPVLVIWGDALTDQNRYCQLTERYGSALWGEFPEEGYAACDWEYLEDDWELLDENSVARICFWGLRADGDRTARTSFRIINDYFLKLQVCDFPLEVRPAFPNQRFLGEFENRQIAPGDLRSLVTEIDFTNGGNELAPAGGATWTVMDAYFDPSDKPSAEVVGQSNLRSRNVSFDGRALHYGYEANSGDPLCSGAYALVGRTVNLYTGRQITGYYTLDVVLYMSVGACVCNVGPTVMGYSFVPFCEYTRPYDCDLWSFSLPYLAVVTEDELMQTRYGYITVPANSGDHQFRMSLNGYYDISQRPYSYNCYYIAGYTNWRKFGDFHFYVDGVARDSLLLNRSGFASTVQYGEDHYENGGMGYYRLVRQCDVANLPEGDSYGLSNLLVEAAFGSFEER